MAPTGRRHGVGGVLWIRGDGRGAGPPDERGARRPYHLRCDRRTRARDRSRNSAHRTRRSRFDARRPETRVGTQSVGEYCREIEAYLCQKNDGHLIRVVGPSFELVSGWAAQGVPLKIAYEGIDRYFERYYRKGPRRRPVKIDFCEADVLDVFDEWRRAIGLPSPESPGSSPRISSGQSLREHLQRGLLRLSEARAKGIL